MSIIFHHYKQLTKLSEQLESQGKDKSKSGNTSISKETQTEEEPSSCQPEIQENASILPLDSYCQSD